MEHPVIWMLGSWVRIPVQIYIKCNPYRIMIDKVLQKERNTYTKMLYVWYVHSEADVRSQILAKKDNWVYRLLEYP